VGDFGGNDGNGCQSVKLTGPSRFTEAIPSLLGRRRSQLSVGDGMTGHSEVSRFAPPQTEWRANYVRNSAVKLHPGHPADCRTARMPILADVVRPMSARCVPHCEMDGGVPVERVGLDN